MARAIDISIHAPRVGGDPVKPDDFCSYGQHFNPRPPCGGRHNDRQDLAAGIIFQSTPPVWGATPGATNTGRGD